ncbi:hypothetical protein Celly_1477 [Cellulophaga lytica DSM 7489]|uniref:Uncharacterized protein n=1 Tax=Cellulophaga lytica (strain ATCC 23178 / DSM 7489 / JCM 8516 / NBRC 14961 / NCIMB 1423 / VKM B-1433 / Cy l20) TaxID=867900 RepID=F0RIH3_CELLC|nr:hypothetical protein Celly_1477 [Cellulophaga lytica DSM 7489]
MLNVNKNIPTNHNSVNKIKFFLVGFFTKFLLTVSICLFFCRLFFLIKKSFSVSGFCFRKLANALKLTVGITEVTGLKLMFFGLSQTLAIPSGFGRSRIRRNCGYTLLATVFLFFKLIIFRIIIITKLKFHK